MVALGHAARLDVGERLGVGFGVDGRLGRDLGSIDCIALARGLHRLHSTVGLHRVIGKRRTNQKTRHHEQRDEQERQLLQDVGHVFPS